MIKLVPIIIALTLTISCGSKSDNSSNPANDSASHAAIDSSSGFLTSNYSGKRSRSHRSNSYNRGNYRFLFHSVYIEHAKRQLTNLEKEALEAKKKQIESQTKLNDAKRRIIEGATAQMNKEISKLQNEIEAQDKKMVLAKSHNQRLNKMLSSGQVNGASLDAFDYFITEYGVSLDELDSIQVEPLPNTEFVSAAKVAVFPIKEFAEGGSVSSYLDFLRTDGARQNIRKDSKKAMEPLKKLASLIQAKDQEKAKEFESRKEMLTEQMRAKWSDLRELIKQVNEITNS